VKYDTIIELPYTEGLRPGMSAEVEVILAEHQDVIRVPVSAVVETESHTLCWVKTEKGIERRAVQLGDSNDVFIIARSGLAEGDKVILNPSKHVADAQQIALEGPAETSVDFADAQQSDLGMGSTSKELDPSRDLDSPSEPRPGHVDGETHAAQ
jgi:HlyD family secretion protein